MGKPQIGKLKIGKLKIEKPQKIIIIVLLIFLGLSIIKNPFIKTIVTIGATKVLGAPVHIDGFSFGVFKHAVRIRGFKVYNPKGFPKAALLDIPKIYVEYNLGALFKGKLHLRKLIIILNEVEIIKNKAGKLNVDSLKIAQQKPEPGKARLKQKQMPLQIDLLTLSMGRVVYKDFSSGEKPLIQVFDIKLKNKEYKDLASAQQLAALILLTSMRSTAIKGAAIYGASTLLGVGFLPAGVGITLIGKDSAEEIFKLSLEKAYELSLNTLKDIGIITKQDKEKSIIKAKVHKTNNVTIKIETLPDKTVKITVSARRYFLPKPEIAAGVLYQINDKLKK